MHFIKILFLMEYLKQKKGYLSAKFLMNKNRNYLNKMKIK